jgi:hypothetical protein
MPHGKCNRCQRDAEAFKYSQASDDDSSGFTIGDAPTHYAPNLTLEPVHLAIDITIPDKTLASKKFDFKVTHTMQCNNSHTAPRFIELNGLGMGFRLLPTFFRYFRHACSKSITLRSWNN